MREIVERFGSSDESLAFFGDMNLEDIKYIFQSESKLDLAAVVSFIKKMPTVEKDSRGDWQVSEDVAFINKKIESLGDESVDLLSEYIFQKCLDNYNNPENKFGFWSVYPKDNSRMLFLSAQELIRKGNSMALQKLLNAYLPHLKPDIYTKKIEFIGVEYLINENLIFDSYSKFIFSHLRSKEAILLAMSGYLIRNNVYYPEFLYIRDVRSEFLRNPYFEELLGKENIQLLLDRSDKIEVRI